ncbi:hypothetical protein ACOSP6_02960 [Tenacibaculum sp. MEBiC06402]|uniref:hypothetical protein n=1 Tax=unclassified Tenacibaculum TaxID=2635139 RepID=UPI003B9B1736
MKNFTFIAVIIMSLFIGCQQNKSSIEGLWVVKSVQIGNQEMTPNARWMKFNADFTQESGNGWFQHSIGTWNLNKETKELTVINTNGVNDTAPPFVVNINGESMTWTRTEEGQPVKVILKKSTKLPKTYGDQLLGLWKLESFEGKGSLFNDNGFLFLRWDRRFNINSSLGKFSGVYNVHGHKPEIELIPYGDKLKRSFWKINFLENKIVLTLLNSDSAVTRSFVRIHDFPN